MTEDEARKKWCPFARQMVELQNAHGNPMSVASANRFNDGTSALCMGSGCMAWRTQRLSNGSNFYKDGYCGLAGAPQ